MQDVPKEVIFVFGSNLAGIHGAGAALCAARQHGAVRGVGEGRTGRSYALPTKDEHIQTRSLADIEVSVKRFLEYARLNEDLVFMVTRVGCGLAGCTDEQIGPMFAGAPPNCQLPDEWRSIACRCGETCLDPCSGECGCFVCRSYYVNCVYDEQDR